MDSDQQKGALILYHMISRSAVHPSMPQRTETLGEAMRCGYAMYIVGTALAIHTPATEVLGHHRLI